MCRRVTNNFSCGHSEDATVKCRSKYSSIIPKKCLEKLTIPSPEDVKGVCMSCSIQKHNAAQKKKIKDKIHEQSKTSEEEAGHDHVS